MASASAPSLKLKLFHHRHCHRHSTITLMMRVDRPRWDPPGLTAVFRRLPAHLLASCTSSDGGAAGANSKPSDIKMFDSVSSGDGYLGLFVRMLGLDNDPLDREQALITLWKYSEGGKNCIDGIMQYPGCINLIISLLKSDSSTTCEATAGLLRNISSINLYRDTVAESGAIEELAGVLCQSILTSEVKEQSLCTLWNLSIDEKLRIKIANSDLLSLLVKFLDDEEIKVKEAAGGVLANLALSHDNHRVMVEAGVIPKLGNLLKNNDEGFKVIRKEAKSALLELSKDEYYRILIIEEGLVRVPIIGAAAYKAFKPVSQSWPSLPDGTEFQQSSRPSRYGASELLLGLNVREKNLKLEEAKMNAIVGRSQQQFLARIGAIEMEDGRKTQLASPQNQQHTLLPWMDGVARLVLILGLEDVSAISRASHSIADASVTEHMRISFKEAGAVRHLVRLLHHNNEIVREAATHALQRLCASYDVCQVVEAEGAVDPLVNTLKQANTSQRLKEETVCILSRMFDPCKVMKKEVHDKLGKVSEKVLTAASSSQDVAGLMKSPDLLSASAVATREKIIVSDVVSCLIDILRESSPNLQKKAASILEYIASFEPHMITIMAVGTESALDAVFQQLSSDDVGDSTENQLELNGIEAEEIGLAIAAASRLLTKLLNFDQFSLSIDSKRFVHSLRKILRSNIPLHTKDWVAACLVKLEAIAGSDMGIGYPIDMEVTLYETIPRLVEQMRASFSYESQEAAVIELNEIISKGDVECTRAIAAAGGIFPLVKLMEEGSGGALEASLAILYNMSMDSENHSAIVAAGAVPVLKRIVLSEGPQWTRALHLLRSLPT